MDSNISHGLKISIVEGSFAQVHINLTAGMFLTSIALYIGLNDIGIGLLSAIPAFFAGFAFFSRYFVKILTNRRTLCVLFSGLGRGVFLVLGILLLCNIPINHGVFFVVIIFHNLLMNLAQNTWLSWMHDMVPKKQRGRYFGIRNTILNIVGMAANIIGGKILDSYRFIGDLAHGLGLLFTGASVSSSIGAMVLTQQPEPPRKEKPMTFLKMFSAPFQDTDFQKLLIFISCWFLLGGMSAPFYVVHMLTNLKMSYVTVALFSLLAGISALIFQNVWGYAIDKLKAKPVLTINYWCSSILPLLWLFAKKDFLLPIWIDAFLTGIFWTGINLGLFNLVFSLAENKDAKESYFAVFTTISGIFAFLSALAGGFAAQLLINFQYHVFNLTLLNYHVLFLSTAVVRFFCTYLLIRVPEQEAYATLKVLQMWSGYTLKRLALYRGLVLNAFKLPR